jgi:hypothetical protein
MLAVILFENISQGRNETNICASIANLFLLIAAVFYFPFLESVLAIYLWRITRRHVRSLNNQEYTCFK